MNELVSVLNVNQGFIAHGNTLQQNHLTIYTCFLLTGGLTNQCRWWSPKVVFLGVMSSIHAGMEHSCHGLAHHFLASFPYPSPTHTFPHLTVIDQLFSHRQCKWSQDSTSLSSVKWESTFFISKVMHEVYEDTVKQPYIPEGNAEPKAAGVEKLEFVILDNGME